MGRREVRIFLDGAEEVDKIFCGAEGLED